MLGSSEGKNRVQRDRENIQMSCRGCRNRGICFAFGKEGVT